MHPLPLARALSWVHPMLGMGPVYRRFVGFLPPWMAATALTALGAWLALRGFQPRLDGPPGGPAGRLWARLYAPLRLRRDWAWLTGFCMLLLLATDYQGFTQGFFRWDDFAFVQDAREDTPLLKLLRTYHNVHSLPLFRLWVSGIVHVMGPSASAAGLARGFNIVGYLSCLGALLGGVALLGACAARRITAIGFCVFAWSWPGWGEFTAGYYTLIVYPQTLLVGLASIALALRYLRGGAPGWMAGSIACALLASGLDVSGMWVFPALGGFAWAVGGGRTGPARRFAPWLLAAFLLAAYYHLVWTGHPFEGREFEQNPGGQAVGHTIMANLAGHIWGLPLAFASGVGGTLTSTFIPGMLGMVAPRFYANAVRSAPLYAAEALVLAGAVWLGWRQAGRLAAGDRRLAAAIALPVVLLIGMTSIARADGLDLPGSLWPAKYLCVPHAWAVLAAVFLMDRAALGSPERARRSARWIAGALVASIWMVASCWYLERALAIHAARQPAGREGNAAVARLRRADFESFERDIGVLARLTGRRQLAVPPPAGMFWAHPYLEYGYTPAGGGTYGLADLLSVAPDLALALEERPREKVPPETLRAIEGDPSLRRLFGPGPPSRTPQDPPP